eukprot:scaffold15350_cov98-Isochrysis_galbana.AAC.5
MDAMLEVPRPSMAEMVSDGVSAGRPAAAILPPAVRYFGPLLLEERPLLRLFCGKLSCSAARRVAQQCRVRTRCRCAAVPPCGAAK